jgi:hypothetical protein
MIEKIVMHGGETRILGMFIYTCGCSVNDNQRSYYTRILPYIHSCRVLRDSCHMLPDKTTQLPPLVQDLERHHTNKVLVTVLVESNDMPAHARDTPVFIPETCLGHQMRIVYAINKPRLLLLFLVEVGRSHRKDLVFRPFLPFVLRPKSVGSQIAKNYK